MSVAAVVLAAGASRRLGRPKQALVHEGETLVVRAARISAEAGLAPVFVVMRAGASDAELRESEALRVVLNDEAEEGMAASIRHGVAAAEAAGASGVVVLACDQPGLDSKHLETLVADRANVAASAYGSVRGIPAYFPAGVFAQLMELRGDVGARALLRDARVVENEALAFDVDTPEDVARLAALRS